MSRPQHLPCVNTKEGIMRINEEQRRYDENPARYEREEREAKEERERQEQEEREYYENR
jgi:hypothetical protein